MTRNELILSSPPNSLNLSSRLDLELKLFISVSLWSLNEIVNGKKIYFSKNQKQIGKAVNQMTTLRAVNASLIRLSNLH